MRATLNAAGILVALFVPSVACAQVVHHESDKRPTESSHSIQAQPGISNALAAVLTRSCGDCHSNTMVSGWYTRVPPFTMLMARGAREGRKAVNFSEWAGYSPEQQRDLLLASCKDATLGTMPVKAYLRVRRDAALSAGDVETICSSARHVEPRPAKNAARIPREP